MVDKDKKVLLNNISSLFSVQIANYVLPMVSVPIIVRIIGPDKYGLINYAAAIVSYFILVVNYGFDLTATRQVAQNKDNKQAIQELFSIVLWCKILLFLLTLIVFLGCFVIFPVFRVEWRIMIYTYIALVSWVITPNWIYQGMQELHRIAIFDIVIKLLFTITVLLVIRQKSDYIYQPLAAGITQIIIGYYSFHYAMRRYDLKLIKVSLKKVVFVLKEERIVFFSSIVINLYTTTNTVILGSLAGITQVGYYSAAIRFIQMAQAVITLPLSNSFFPYVGAAFGKSKNDGIAAARKVLPVVTIIALAAFLGMITIGPWALELFYGKKFEPSVPIFITLAITPLVIVISNVFGILVMMNLKMDKAFLRITAFGALVSIVSNLLLVPWAGGLGSAFSLLITECFITVTMGLFLLKQGIKLFDQAGFNPKKIMLQFQSVLPGFKKNKIQN
jgi:O-antigen/teichoic acid export membrane protein